MLIYTPFFFVFCYILWHFYTFYGTNLLTRCHSASSWFLLFLCFRKVTQEIFSELDETKAKVPIFPDTRRSPKQRRREARGWPHPRWCGSPLGRAWEWCAPLVHFLTSPLRLYILLDDKTLRARSIFQKLIMSCRRRRPEIGRVQKLFQALIRLKCIYNFLCSMLVFTPFGLCFVILRGIFMHFLELTY
jgi:hypothetical protein